MKERILTAFWHKGRQAFVPWLAHEIARRVGRYEDDVQPELRGLLASGLARTKPTHLKNGGQVWELTPTGQVEARAIIAANEFAKGTGA